MARYIVTDRIRVNIIHSFAVPPRVKCEQYDGDYTKLIKAIVYNGDVLYDIPSAVRRIVVSGLKPDGNGFSYDCTWSGNTVSFSLMRQMTAVNGNVPCNITMFDSRNNQISSAVFVLDVEKAALPSDVVVSSNDFQTFVDYVQAANLYWQYSKSYAVGNTGIRSGENTDNSQYYAHLARIYKGSPLTAATASAMTDRTRVYVYTGSETGYNKGHWYYYNDSAWVDGGVYNAQGIQTDTELTTPGIAADAKAVGDVLGHESLETIAQTISGAINELDELSAFVTPEFFGAKGDGVTDDYIAIQAAIDSGKNVLFGRKSYFIGNNTILIEDPNMLHASIIAYGSKIIYTGTGYAVRFRRISEKTVIFNEIQAENGSCIELFAEHYTQQDRDRVQYLNLYFGFLFSLNYCIHAKVMDETTWINEIRLHGGAFRSGSVGLYLEKVNPDGLFDGWRITEVGIEGVNIGIELQPGNGAIANLECFNCRNMEMPPQYLLKTNGRCFNIRWTSPDHTLKRFFSISNSSTGIMLNVPIYESHAGGGAPLSLHSIIEYNNTWIYDLPETLSITYNSNVTVNAEFTRVRRIGFEIELHIMLTSVTMAPNTVLCTLPYAPVASIRFSDNKGNTWQIGSNGALVNVDAITNQSPILLNLTYVYYVKLYY